MLTNIPPQGRLSRPSIAREHLESDSGRDSDCCQAAENSSTTPASSRQNRSTLGMLTRSPGECGASICGPKETMSSRGTRSPITAVSSQACTAVTVASSRRSRL